MPSAEPPKVTGLSPKEALPGAKITIRGENLGFSQDDLISVTVCGVECLMYAEWKSSSKIISRCGPVTPGMRGEVIVSTKSGGRGSCTVQFRVSSEPIGPTTESAVWVDESHLFNIVSGRNRPTSPSELQPADPLGLSDEANVGRFPEEELHDLFPDGSGNILSENFVPTWYLLENHHKTSFDDLKAGHIYLTRKVTQHKDEPLSFLKSSASSIVECMDALLAVSSALEKDKQAIEGDLTINLERKLSKIKKEADDLFEEMLFRKEKGDSTRNALSVLQRFRFLFNLPANIEKNIQKGDYDIVINDYARAKSLFQDTEVEVFKKVYLEVETRIEKFRQMLLNKLRNLPASLEEQKRLIKFLVNLETPQDPAWDSVLHNKSWLLNAMNASNIKHRNEVETGREEKDTHDFDYDPPEVVKFIVDITSIFSEHFQNFWKLGQAYLSGQLHVREASEVNEQQSLSRNTQFKNMVLDITHRFCELIYMALSPHSCHSLSSHQIQTSAWPKSVDSLTPWLPHCLRCIRNCHASLLKLDLPDEMLKMVQQLIFDIRVDAMKTLFRHAAEDVSHLDEQETWVVEIDDHNGGITQLPSLFENRVIETLHLVQETVLLPGPKEADVFSHINVQGSFKQAAQDLLQAFAMALEKMAQRCCKNEQSKMHETFGGSVLENGDELSDDAKCLIILTNCNYTVKSIIPRLQECFTKHGYPDMTLVIRSSQAKFREVDAKIFESYVERKCDPVVCAIEQRMYAGCFSWDSCYRPTGVSVYIKETIMSMIEIHAEVFSVSPPLVSRVLTRLVEAVVEELSRLHECVERFEGNGNIQATLNLRALEDALSAYKTSNTSKHFMICRSKLLPFANSKDSELVNELLKTFKKKIWLQLLCFKEASLVTV